MDPLLIANLKMTRTTPTTSRPPREVRIANPEVQRLTPEFRTCARTELGRERQKRGKLMFLERMEADVVNRRALNQVCSWRQDLEKRRVLDQAVNKHRPRSAPIGPRIVTLDRRTMYDGHDRAIEWPALEQC